MAINYWKDESKFPNTHRKFFETQISFLAIFFLFFWNNYSMNLDNIMLCNIFSIMVKIYNFL